MNKYHERWGQRTYLGILSGTDINGGILNAATHEYCLSIHLQRV